MGQSWAAQDGFDLRFEWGPAGVEALRDHVSGVVIVDVLRFTTAVDAAVSRGAAVYPYRWSGTGAADHARSVGARLAQSADPAGLSLSPASLLELAPGEAVVLPSPNGSTCAVLAAEAGVEVLAACLRNAAAVAGWLAGRAGPVGVIACGERWPDGSLRPAAEDLIGAGAVVARLPGRRSPEADLAASAWRSAAGSLDTALYACGSGRELLARGRAEDIRYAAAADVSACVPVLAGGCFRDIAARDAGLPT